MSQAEVSVTAQEITKEETQEEKQKQATPRPVETETRSSDEYVACIRPICEHDEGWHVAESFTALPSKSVDPYAAYLARVMTIVKTGSMANEMRIFFSEQGRRLLGEIENKAISEEAERRDMTDSYTSLRAFFASELESKRVFSIAATDSSQSLIDLNRLELDLCELKNGKLLWLCPRHVEKTNATVIQHVPRGGVNLAQNSSIYNKMLEFIHQED